MNKKILFFLSIGTCFTAHAMEELDEDLIKAARVGSAQQLQQLIDAGANVNAQNKYGSTALIYAAYGGHVNCVKLLLQSGASVVLQNLNNQTAFWFAVFFNYQPCCKLLLDRMMQLPTDAQKQRIFTFFICLKHLDVPNYMRTILKPYVLASIEEENFENPENSIAWEEIFKLKFYTYYLQKEPLFDYLKRKQIKGHDETKEGESSWCAIQ